MYFVSNCSVTYVTEFSKAVHCPRKIITVSVATGTTLSLPRATDNFITYKSGLLLLHFLPAKQTSGERAARLKGPARSAKIPAGCRR